MKLVENGLTKNVGATGKGFKRYLVNSALTATGFIMMMSPALADNWVDHTGAGITIDTSVPNTTNITQHLDVVKVHGDGDINAGWTVNVAQPSSSSKYVLYDIENDPTEILGTLNANGRVYIFDQNGVIFGAGSQVNVGSIVTSTGFVSDENLTQDKLVFENVGGDGQIINNGTINVAQAGLAAFVAPTIINNGVINAKLGTVAMASGDKVTLDLYGDKLVEIAVEGELENALIENSGSIKAEGGHIAITAAAAKDAVDNVINMSGVADVSSVSVKGGKIILGGGNNGTVKVSGKLDASGTSGGDVKVTGQAVLLDTGSEIVADAGENGDGGKIGVFGNSYAIMGGSTSARGGSNSGNGGFIELSAHDAVGFSGLVDTSAAAGETGTFLIDPETINLGNFSLFDTGTLTNLKVDAQSLANTLRLSNVHLWATNNIFTSSAVDLSTWQGVLPWNRGITTNDLTLSANTININHDIILGEGNLILRDALTTDSIFGFGLITPPSNINLETVNLNAKILGRDTVGGATSVANLVADQIRGMAETVNVISPLALINQAIAFVQSGGTVNVGDGVYEENVKISKSDLKLQSVNGRDHTTINGQAAGAEEGTIYLTAGANNVQIGDIDKGFKIFGLNGSGNSEKAAVYLKGNHDNVKVIGNELVAQGDSGFTSEYSAVINDLTLDNNIFSGKTFEGANPSGIGSGTQFEPGNNVPRQLVVIGGGAGGGNTSNVTFTNNVLTGTTGGISTDDGVSNQGNWQVTIDSQGATITDNAFMGTTTGNGFLRARGTNTLISGNGFDGAGLSNNALYVSVSENIHGAGTQPDITHLFANNFFVSNAVVSSTQMGTTDVISKTIQGAVNVSEAGAFLYAINGTYDESVYINKANLTLMAANNGVNPNTTARYPETIINAQDWYGIYTDHNNITIDGVTVRQSAADGYGIVGVNANNFTIRNNILTGGNFGVFNYGGTATNGLIQNNKFSGINGVNGQAIHIRDNQYADILGNDISDVNVGITTENFSAANPTGNRSVIDSNTISAKLIGIRNNLSYNAQTGFTISNNTITAEDPANARRWTGIDVISQQSGAETILLNNNIDGSAVSATRLASGYELTNMTNTNRAVIDGGNLENLDYGIWATDGNFYTGAVTDLLIQNVAFSNMGNAAILAEDVWDAEDPLKSVNATGTNITIGSGNTFSNTPYELAIAGENVSVNDNAVMSTLVKAAGPSTFVGAPSGYVGGQWEVKNASIQKGVNATKQTGTVTVESGTFTEQVVINKSLNLLGDGAYNTTILNAPTVMANSYTQDGRDNYAVIYVHDAATVNIDGFQINGSTNTGNSYNNNARFIGVAYRNAGGNFTNNWVKDIATAGNTSRSGFAFLATAKNTNSVLNINNNEFTGFQTYGIALADPKLTATVTNNTITGNKDTTSVVQSGIFVTENPKVTVGGADPLNGNTISEVDYGIELFREHSGLYQNNDIFNVGRGFYVNASNYNDIFDNKINNATDTGIYIRSSIFSDVQGNKITNSKDGIFTTLSDNTTIQKNVLRLLTGNGISISDSDDAIIKANRVNNVSGYGIQVATSEDARVQGNTVFKTGANGINVLGSADAIIMNNNVGAKAGVAQGAGNIKGNGIHVVDSDSARIQGNYVTETVAGPLGSGSGIYVESSDNAIIGGVGKKQNTVSAAAWDGIKIERGDGVVINNNDVSNIQRVGIYAAYATNLTIKNNNVDNTTFGIGAPYGGISTDWGSDITVLGNTISNSGQGVRMYNAAGNNRIVENIIDNVSDNGIHVYDMVAGSSVRILRNVLGYGADGVLGTADDTMIGANGIYISSAPDAIVRRNSIANVGSNGIYASGLTNGSFIRNTVTGAPDSGFYLAGPNNGYALIAGNTFRGNNVGATFESGTIDLTDPRANRFIGGSVGIRFAPYQIGGGPTPTFASLNLVDDDGGPTSPYVAGVQPTNYGGTIGAQIFRNQSGNYIELANEAFYSPGNPTWINATNSRFISAVGGYDITPSDYAGLILPADEIAFLQSKLYHYPNGQIASPIENLGVFFFGAASVISTAATLANINQNLIFNQFGAFNGDQTGLNVQIRGLPTLPGQANSLASNLNNLNTFAGNPAALNNIETASGGSDQTNNNTPDDLNEIETASGDTTENCWGNAANNAGGGQVVNVVYSGSFADNMNDVAACGL